MGEARRKQFAADLIVAEAEQQFAYGNHTRAVEYVRLAVQLRPYDLLCLSPELSSAYEEREIGR